ncbi:MAG: hypothetical protein WA843_04230 [Candidatus Saccharimonadales bacterium]
MSFHAERRQKKLQAQIEQVSVGVARSITQRLSEGELTSSQFSIGKKPPGIDVGNYIEEVKAATFRNLGKAGLTAFVYFDEEATCLASTRIVELEPGYSEQIAKRGDLVVVFTKSPVLH